MPFLIGAMRFVVSFMVATALFWLGIAFEHRPAGWPSIKVGPFHWQPLPDGPWARLAAIDRIAATQAAHNRVVTVQRAAVSHDASVAEDKAQERIRYITRVQIKEIPVVVTPAIDRSFPLPVGLIRMHDAAARGVLVSSVPGPAGQPDDAASNVKASDFAGALVTNYGACRADDEQLGALQQWLRDQAAVK